MPLVKLSGIMDMLGGGAMTLGGAARFISGDPLDSMALFSIGGLRDTMSAGAAQRKAIEDSIKASKDVLLQNKVINQGLAEKVVRRAQGNKAMEPMANTALAGAVALPVAATGAAVTKNVVDPEDEDDKKYSMKKRAFLSALLAGFAPSLVGHLPSMLMAAPALVTGVNTVKTELKKRDLDKANNEISKAMNTRNELNRGIKQENWNTAKNIGKAGLLAASVPASYYLYKKMTGEDE